MENLIGRYRNVNILAIVIVIQILGLAVQVKRSTENQSSRLIRVWAVTAVTPLEKLIVSAQSGATGLWHNYFYLRGVRQENRELREQIEQLQLEQVRLKQDADQAHRLQALLGFKEQIIDKIMTDEEVKPGDRVLTSGGDQIFPKGLPVGNVVKISKGSEFLQITVKPAAILNHLEEV